jgi:hypothetical protein
MTVTVPSTTLEAVSSSMAHAGTAMEAAHCSASATELPGMPSGARCTDREVDEAERAIVTGGRALRSERRE